RVARQGSVSASADAGDGTRAHRWRRWRAASRSWRRVASTNRRRLGLASSLRRCSCGRLARWMHRGEECDERVDLRGGEVLAVGRHIAATLNYLAHDLIAGQARGGVVERGPAHPTCAAERVAVAALLALHENRALQFERSAALDVI